MKTLRPRESKHLVQHHGASYEVAESGFGSWSLAAGHGLSHTHSAAETVAVGATWLVG